MLGTLSQLIALASAANGALTGRDAAETFYPDHSAFQFCNSVRFVDVRKGLLGRTREAERHKDPNDWIGSLTKLRVGRAWLTFTEGNSSDAPDHQLAAFVGGGGDWQLVVTAADETELWMSRWEVTKQNAADNRIWSVTYGCVGKIRKASVVPNPNLHSAASRLQSALTATREFATTHELPLWADWFERALKGFEPSQSATFPDYIEFVNLDSYPEIAQRIFAAAYNGWVFGGMGSWNDLYFEPESENDRYNELSAELYSAINDGLQQATWSFGGNTDS